MKPINRYDEDGRLDPVGMSCFYPEVAELEVELSRLTEKYSRVCDECSDGIIFNDCELCQGTGRIWMMGVEEVRKETIIRNSDLLTYYVEGWNEAITRILGGGQ